jgi:hypothetical protein
MNTNVCARQWLPRRGPWGVALGIAMGVGLATPTQGMGQEGGESATVDLGFTIDIEEIAVLGIGGTLQPWTVAGTPTNPGAWILADIDRDPELDFPRIYLRYTSLIQQGQTRKLTAEIGQNGVMIPSGLAIEIQVDPKQNDVSTFGTFGERAVTTMVPLSTTPLDLVTGIGTGYTGTVGTYGWPVSVVVTILSTADLYAQSADMMVTFTLTEGS